MNIPLWNRSCFLFFYCLFTSLSYANNTSGVMDLTDRGSVTDTPYTVPNKKIIMEGGYQFITLQEDGPLSALPAMEIDFGLPFNTELIVQLPTYYFLHKPQLTGFDTTVLGVTARNQKQLGPHSKHEVGPN